MICDSSYLVEGGLDDNGAFCNYGSSFPASAALPALCLSGGLLGQHLAGVARRPVRVTLKVNHRGKLLKWIRKYN